MGEQQRTLRAGVRRGGVVLLVSCLLAPCVVTGQMEDNGEEEQKMKVLSFGGNGNIGSAVLAKMIETERFDIVMTTRGGWHWDSDTRIGKINTLDGIDGDFIPFISCRSRSNCVSS